MPFACPVCGTAKPTHTTACLSCGWTPKKDASATAVPLTPTQARPWRLVATGLVALIIASGSAWFMWKSRAPGSDCHRDSDCNTMMCLHVVIGERWLADIGRPGVCTDFCDSDSDCPGTMECGTAGRDIWRTAKRHPGDELATELRVCIPRGVGLLERLSK